MNECPFCTDKIVQERCITRTAHAWAFPTNIPITPMHTIVAPVRHVERFEQLTEGERKDVLEMVFSISNVLREKFGVEGFNYAWNDGRVAGQNVPHLHMHIVPRTTGDAGITEYEPRKFLYRPGSRETTPETELQDIARVMRSALE